MTCERLWYLYEVSNAEANIPKFDAAPEVYYLRVHLPGTLRAARAQLERQIGDLVSALGGVVLASNLIHETTDTVEATYPPDNVGDEA